MTRLSLFTTSLLLALSACSDPSVDPGGDDDVAPDAAEPEPEPDAAPDPDAAPPAARVEITVREADYVACRDGDGPWVPATSLGDDRYELDATNEYTCFIGCDGYGIGAQLVGGTVAEAPPPILGCASPPFSPVVLHTVTTTMDQPGTVIFGRIGSDAQSDDGPWDVTLRPPSGVRDLIAFTSSRILIRRAIDVTGDGTLPAIDMDVEGSPLEEVTVELPNVEDVETVAAWANLTIGDRSFDLEGAGVFALRPPAGLFTPAELADLRIVARADGNRSERTTSAVSTGAATETLTLMTMPGSLEFNPTGWLAWWQSLPEVDLVELWASTITRDGLAMAVARVTGGWIEAKGVTQVGFTDVPDDVDPSWFPVPGETTYMNLRLHHQDGTTRREAFIANDP